MKAALALFICLILVVSSHGGLTDVQMAQIRSQAEAEAKQLMSPLARSASSDAEINNAVNSLVLEKATSAIEMHLLKAAAKASAHAASAHAGRRLLTHPVPLETIFAEYNIEEEAENSVVASSSTRHLLQYSPSPLRLSNEEASPYCSFQQDTSFTVDYASGKGLENGFIEGTDPGACCAACLFRLDCFAWTVKIGLRYPLDGCYLRGRSYGTANVTGWISGTMSSDVTWEPPATPKPGKLPAGKKKYGDVLKLTANFFSAQRSGEISDDSVPWRGNSHLDDAVPGGWYDAGDTLKLNFPMSTSVSFISWAMISFPKAFRSNGATAEYMKQLRVATDYLLGCYDENAKKYIGQIGHPNIDHNNWGRPEDNNDNRPAFVWEGDMTASDLLSSAAAAWASSSILFKNTDPSYSNVLKKKARAIYSWAKSAPNGRYSAYYKDAVGSIYPSTDYVDDLTWAAAWLYKATGDRSYLKDAEGFWKSDAGSADIYPGWDSVWVPTAVLMRQIGRSGVKIPGKKMYDSFYEKQFLPTWLTADGTNSVTRTPKGMTHPSWSMWANLQFSTTTAMLMLQDTIGNKSPPMRKAELKYATREVNYVLGSTGRSFIVGWGKSPPKNIHHAPSTCADSPEVCNWQNYFMKAGNAQTVYGAMVAGPGGKKRYPDKPDYYLDVRSDYVTNEVSLNYNAGLVGALAGMYAFSP
ncbi:hypothetical protein Ndes2526B_g05083 [Nannochloris sp. 'desiccata']